MKMKTWIVSIKSHCQAPDFEYEVTAESLDSAVEKIWNSLSTQAKSQIDKDMIRKNTGTFENIMTRWLNERSNDELQRLWQKNKR